MSDIWYYADQNGPVGPITIRDLKDALATFSDPKSVFVWRDGFASWTRAGDVSELKAPVAAAAVPPPLPPAPPSKAIPNTQVPPREVLMALPASFVAAVVLTGIGSLSLLMCLYFSIVIALAAGVFLIRPLPRVLLSRLAGLFLLAVAGLSVAASTALLQREKQELVDACSGEGDRSVPDIGDRSIAGCTLIIQDQDTSPEDRIVAHRWRGIAYDARRNYDRAIADYSEAIRLDGRSATDYYNRGLVYHAMGDNGRAIADYSEAIRLDTESGGNFGEDAIIYYSRGLAYQAKGDKDRAIADYREAIKIDPEIESELETALKSSLAPAVYEALVAERRAKQVANLKDVLRVNGLDIDSQYNTYVRLSELEPANGSYKQEVDKLKKQIAIRDAGIRAALEKARQDAELKAAEQRREELQIGLCRSDWTKCADNAQLANNYSRWFDAKAACKTEANERAQYGTPVWPWLSYFGTFRTGKDYVTSGIAVAIEPDAQFQNGFGAMVHSRVTCTYDLRAQRVVSVDISPR
jgi:hypothetical protein